MKFPTLASFRRPASALGAIGAGAALLLTLAACAPASSPKTDLKTDTTTLSVEDWRQQMDDCMLKAGFDIRPTEGSGDLDLSQFDMDKFDAAYAECTTKVGEVPTDPNQPTEDEMFETQLVFAKCMREAGYDYPDPVKGSGGMGQAFGPETNPDDIDNCTAEANAVVSQ